MKRIFSAIILIPAALLAVIYATPVFYLTGVGALGTLCLYEYCGLIRNMGIRVQARFVFPVFWILLGVLGCKTVYGWNLFRESGIVAAAFTADLSFSSMQTPLCRKSINHVM